MSAINTNRGWVPHLPRTVVALIGLWFVHLLAGDAFATWSMLGVAAFALLARTNGLREKRATRIELSIAATACVLIFIQGGFVEHFNRLTLPAVAGATLLLCGLNATHSSSPQLRIVVNLVLLVLFFLSQRYFYPHLIAEFANPLLAIGLLVIAWELLSSLIHSEDDAPSLVETGATLTVLLIYYSKTADFLLAALFSTSTLLAYFLGASRPQARRLVTVKFQSESLISGGARAFRPYAFLSSAGIGLFFAFGWILLTTLKEQPPLESLRVVARPLEIEQRNRVDQAFLSYDVPPSKPAEPLGPLNLNILEEALLTTAQDSHSPNPQKIFIRRSPSSEDRGLNVERHGSDPIQTTRISRIPGLRISAPNASLPLPDYSSTSELESSQPNQLDRPIQYDFGFGSEQSDNSPVTEKRETLSLESAGGPIRIPAPPAETSLGFSSSISRKQKNPNTKSPVEVPQNIQSSIGFSPDLQYASNVSVSFKTRPIIEVQLPGSAKWMNQLYLRFNTLERLEADRFVPVTQDTRQTHAIDAPGWNTAPEAFRSPVTSDGVWTIALADDWQSPLPLLGPFDQIRIPQGVSLIAKVGSLSLHRTAGSGPLAYQISGPQISNTWPSQANTLSKEEIERLTDLPLSSKEIAYLKRLGDRIAGRNPTPEQFVRRVDSYFRRVHPYAFDFEFKVRDDEHLLVSWLRSRSPGICGYYAGAFTLLARAQGMPARVVIGALSREFDPRARTFTIRDRDAHAWAEYLNNQGEWVRADLTPIALDSPRFASAESEFSEYASNIEVALQRLNRSDENAEPASAESSSRDLLPASATDEHLAKTTENQDLETVPSTLEMIDKVLAEDRAPVSHESVTTGEILAATASLGEGSNSPSEATPNPPISPTRIEPAPSASSPKIEQKDEARPVAVAPDDDQPEPVDRTFSPRVALNYIFAALFIGFAASQLYRSRLFDTDRMTATRSPVHRERSLAGRLLREIDTAITLSPDVGGTLQGYRQRALQLRYSPQCPLDEVKALKRDFRRWTSQR